LLILQFPSFLFLTPRRNRDVHVIDLDNGQAEDSKNKKNNNNTTNGSSSVHIHLAAGGWADEEMSQPRDVALVLKSAQPVVWIVSSAPVLTGSLLILAEHQVEIGGLSARQQADVRSNRNLPSEFALLILSVTADINPPVSYVKAPPATNSIEIVIGKKQQQQLRLLSSSKRECGVHLRVVARLIRPPFFLLRLSSPSHHHHPYPLNSLENSCVSSITAADKSELIRTSSFFFFFGLA
jgi:hypothetical protein